MNETVLRDISTPNVHAFEWHVDDDPLPWVVYRMTPGTTTPRISHGPHDYGRIAAPERYGKWGSSKPQFQRWAQAYADDVAEKPLSGALAGEHR